MIDGITWYGHSTFMIEGATRIMIDPWSVPTPPQAPDVILVSHEHYDHCSPADIAKLRAPHTRVIASRTAAEQIDGDVTVLRPWQTINIGRTSIRTVPAYTFTGDHPAQREDLGFIISQNYTDIYFSGDTDFVPELAGIHCDVAILPVGSRDRSLSTDFAAEFVRRQTPRYVIASHVGNHAASGSLLELQALQAELNGVCDIILPDELADLASSGR